MVEVTAVAGISRDAMAWGPGGAPHTESQSMLPPAVSSGVTRARIQKVGFPVVASARKALAAHLAAVGADATKEAPQLNTCNDARALWPPKQRAAVQPPDEDTACSY